MSDIRKAGCDDYPRLAEIWEEAVRATHDFLDAAYFDRIKAMLPQYFRGCDIYVHEEDGTIDGFIGLSGDMIEMLFVGRRGAGIGTRLLDFATGEKAASKVDVNEQNKGARGFYERYGFTAIGRSELDGMGKPYPLVNMKLRNKRYKTMERKVRVRFAPSPTGPLHMGGVRTALYNYLFARRNGGDFLLRIEDTDSQRFVPGAEDYINEALEWCGIKVDEGVREGGPHAPYRQSERKDIYLSYALQLVESGNAYYAFDTPEQLQELRSRAEAAGSTFAYDHTVRDGLETSLRLLPEEVRSRIDAGEQWVIRFKMPAGEDVEMDDLIRGHVTINTSTLDDKVLFKSADMLPTYHLANVVDDYLMEISHVIRGEEWLPSLPLHYLLYRAFGWEDRRPEFAHLPLLLKPTGKGKLSKRDGDKMGFPVFPLEWKSPETGEISRGYREDGYFPEAFVNMLALLGWNSGTDQEIFSMDELIEAFSLEKVGKSGARFDPEKAKWFNAQYMHRYDNGKLATMLAGQLAAQGIDAEQDKIESVIGLIKERAVFPADFWELSGFFFVAPAEYASKPAEKFWKGDNPARVAEARDMIAALPSFAVSDIDKALHEWIEGKGYPMGQIMNCLRLALVGDSKGPGIADIMAVIGRDDTLARIGRAIEKLG